MIAEGGNELNSGDQASEDSDNDDGAIQSFAVSATAALATLYALTIWAGYKLEKQTLNVPYKAKQASTNWFTTGMRFQKHSVFCIHI